MSPASADKFALITAFANDAPVALSYGPNTLEEGAYGPGDVLYVVGPSANGVLSVPRVFYGPPGKIQERTFLGFTPPDSNATATPATAVTFDLDGTPTTKPTAVARETQGLMNGFGSSVLGFFCF